MSLPPNYTIRRLQADDYHRGVLKTLETLTEVGEIGEVQFQQILTQWEARLHNGGYIYNPTVIVSDTNEVVATGMVFIEEKLIHQGALAGHIEDIAVRADQQGKQLGKILIRELTSIAQKAGCYKVLLDCDPKNEGFYEKCGYHNHGVYMQQRF